MDRVFTLYRVFSPCPVPHLPRVSNFPLLARGFFLAFSWYIAVEYSEE